MPGSAPRASLGDPAQAHRRRGRVGDRRCAAWVFVDPAAGRQLVLLADAGSCRGVGRRRPGVRPSAPRLHSVPRPQPASVHHRNRDRPGPRRGVRGRRADRPRDSRRTRIHHSCTGIRQLRAAVAGHIHHGDQRRGRGDVLPRRRCTPRWAAPIRSSSRRFCT